MPILDDTTGAGTTGQTTTSGAANPGSSWSDIMSGAMGTLGSDPMKLAMLFIIGNYINQKNDQSGITATDALTGSSSKGLTGIQDRYNSFDTLFQNAMSGQAQNSDISGMRDMLKNRATQYTGMNPALMTAMENTALNGSQNPTVNWGNNALQNSLANRFGQRNMRANNVAGQLNPLQLPEGATKLY